MRVRVSPRTAVLGALVSAGVAVTMLATAAAYAPPDPATADTVQVVPQGSRASAER